MNSPDLALHAFLETCRARVNQALDAHLPAAGTHPASLHEAMRYTVLDGGKRVRPMLVYASGQAMGAPDEALDGPACAVEFIHAYSLVHDDLPAMDDDDLRRGKPTCHKVYGEATALLAGDALQALAFYTLAHHQPPSAEDAVQRVRMLESLALAAGSRGMAGGQAIDLDSVGRSLDIAELEDMHIHKTGALIRASVLLGALCRRNPDEDRLTALDHYGKCIGLAFQIRDDILDVESDTQTLGKQSGADQARDKPTYPALLGVDGASRRARELHEEAIASLSDFDERADPLRWLSAYIVQRPS
ncbi:MAG TPA: farnesyl diphosphate synthase [Gammaproteobacteria bacterium]|nr:farnesyl diphosphate synthase [Gammaproteobacteria bacterium]